MKKAEMVKKKILNQAGNPTYIYGVRGTGLD